MSDETYYCTECGQQLIKEMTGKFNPRNGDREFRWVCPIDPCGHTKCVDVLYKPTGLFDSLFGPGFVCARCNKKTYTD